MHFVNKDGYIILKGCQQKKTQEKTPFIQDLDTSLGAHTCNIHLKEKVSTISL